MAIIDTATRGVLAHLIRGLDAAWLVVTPSGLFDGTETAASTLVAWRHGLHTHTPSDLPAGFKVPGLLQKVLNGAAPAPPRALNDALASLH